VQAVLVVPANLVIDILFDNRGLLCYNRHHPVNVEDITVRNTALKVVAMKIVGER
jgi:hypothetical protein